MHQARTLLALLPLAMAACASSEMGVPNVHTVVPGALVRGGQPDAGELGALRQRYGIRTVVNLNDDTAASEAPAVEALGMRYVALPCSAFDPDRSTYVEFLRVMHGAAEHGPVFVHCRHGMDRTGLAVAAYRIVIEGWTAERALGELRSRQAFTHTLALPHFPSFVRAIERERAWWLAQLPARPAPGPAPPAPPPPDGHQPDGHGPAGHGR